MNYLRRKTSLMVLSIFLTMAMVGCKVSPERALTEKSNANATGNANPSSSFSENEDSAILESEGQVWNA